MHDHEQVKCLCCFPATQFFDIRFPKRKVPAEKTTYTCMVVEVPEMEDHHMVANKPLIDNENVMHHLLVYGCQGNQKGFFVEMSCYII